MGIISNYFFTRRALVVMAVDAQAVDAAFFCAGSLSGPEKCRLRIVHEVAGAADTRLQGCLIADVRGFRRHLAQIMFGIDNFNFIAVALGADFR